MIPVIDMREIPDSPNDMPDPPWGAFLAEQYLIQNWNYSTDEEPSAQCQRLVRTFLQSGVILCIDDDSTDQLIPREPSQAEIELILEPWRPQILRRLAAAHKIDRDACWDGVIPILRTHYSSHAQDQEILQRVLDEDADYDPNQDPGEVCWWRCLDDADHFAFGDAWDKVLDILPELTGRGLGRRSSLSMDNLDTLAGAFQPEVEFHNLACFGMRPLALMDKHAFESGKLNLLFLDANGNLVRSTRIEVETLHVWRMTAWRCAVGEMGEFQGAEAAPLYRVDGSIGRLVWQKLEEYKNEQKLAGEVEDRLNLQ